MAVIFINYRRADTAGHAGRIYEHLAGHFGSSNVFLDTGTIAPGDKWPARIEDEVIACQILIAVVGQRWLDARLHDSTDYVRREIVTALRDNKTVIPVLVDGASLPLKKDLPQPLRPILLSQAIWLDHRHDTTYKNSLSILTERVSALTGASTQNTACALTVRRLRRISASAFYFKVLLDEEKIGEIPNDQIRKFRIGPGEHSIQVKAGSSLLGWLSQSISDKLFFTINNGETKRFVCSANWLNKSYINLEEED